MFRSISLKFLEKYYLAKLDEKGCWEWDEIIKAPDWIKT